MSDIRRFASYEEAEEHWGSVERHPYRDLAEGLGFRTEPFALIHDLEALANSTGDQRFQGAVDALSEHRLVEAYRWTSDTPHLFIKGLTQRYEETAAGLVQLLINEGVSSRLAFASSAAQLGWPGNSFAAAVKSVERLWRKSALCQPLDKP